MFVIVCVCVCVCLFVRLRISPPRIKLAASNFARRFIGIKGFDLNLTFWGTLLPQKPRIGRIGQRAGHLHDVHNDYLLAPEYMDVPFVKSRGVWS